ncbi:hypothetical protein CEXT_619241 [Caerostris extrusa]|uniref:Uncharacterized protein n=1 Tax=Caerostris extrusa TaxID=172846 RepID=A0AAV4SA88_CAEEX|nr:hypothetical protein CEXT_619241 [Caerostris extrusa]
MSSGHPLGLLSEYADYKISKLIPFFPLDERSRTVINLSLQSGHRRCSFCDLRPDPLRVRLFSNKYHNVTKEKKKEYRIAPIKASRIPPIQPSKSCRTITRNGPRSPSRKRVKALVDTISSMNDERSRSVIILSHPLQSGHRRSSFCDLRPDPLRVRGDIFLKAKHAGEKLLLLQDCMPSHNGHPLGVVSEYADDEISKLIPPFFPLDERSRSVMHLSLQYGHRRWPL